MNRLEGRIVSQGLQQCDPVSPLTNWNCTGTYTSKNISTTHVQGESKNIIQSRLICYPMSQNFLAKFYTTIICSYLCQITKF